MSFIQFISYGAQGLADKVTFGSDPTLVTNKYDTSKRDSAFHNKTFAWQFPFLLPRVRYYHGISSSL